MSNYFILDQSNLLTTDMGWAEVEKEHPSESGFKE